MSGTAPGYDVAVVGAGFGGIHAAHEFARAGLTVLGIESADDVGGVWYHNRYPGARVDVESATYCFFDPELYPRWEWTERYAAQPEILAYLRHAADHYGVRDLFRFGTRMTGATWDPGRDRYRIALSDGGVTSARFLVLATGQLSDARPAPFAGIADFAGDVVSTAHWPDPGPDLDGRRVGVIGTGSSGIQVATTLAARAARLVVFQRTPHYSVPAHNGPPAATRPRDAAGVQALYRRLMDSPTGLDVPPATVRGADLSRAARVPYIRDRWEQGGHAMGMVFLDQGTDLDVAESVGEFVRERIRETVTDPVLAHRLTPHGHPMGGRRLVVDTGYFEIFNRDGVELVDLATDPLERFVRTGVRTRDATHELDVVVLALGFDAFLGSMERAVVRNEHGVRVVDEWRTGPRSYLGLMGHGFPNLFLLTGPGSPSLLANVVLGNIHHVDLALRLVRHALGRGATRIEPTAQAETAWTAHVAETAEHLIRRAVNNYMVHVAPGGARTFLPYAGGLGRYVAEVEQRLGETYRGFRFGSGPVR